MVAINFRSRGGSDYTANYPSVANELKKIRHDVIHDGEVCTLNEEGLPDFDALQTNVPGTTSLIFSGSMVSVHGIATPGTKKIFGT